MLDARTLCSFCLRCGRRWHLGFELRVSFFFNSRRLSLMHCLEIGTSFYPLPSISRRLRYVHCLKVSFVFPFIYALLPRRWMPTWHSCYPHLNTRRLLYKTASVGIIGKQNSSKQKLGEIVAFYFGTVYTRFTKATHL